MSFRSIVTFLASRAAIIAPRSILHRAAIFVGITLIVLAALLMVVADEARVMATPAQLTAENAAPPHDKENSSGAGRHPIVGRVEHEVALPVLEDQFQPGTKFDESKLMTMTPNNVWIPTPAWFAGKWHSDMQTTTYVYDYEQNEASSEERTTKASGDITLGMQKSKDEQVWHFAKVPKVEKQKTDSGPVYLYIVRDELLSSSESKWVMKFFYYEIKVNAKGTIFDVDRISTINTYTPLDDGTVRLNGSLKSFDEQGKPETLERTEKILKRVAPYQKLDEQDGLNLKQMFVEFLKQSGRGEQVPNEALETRRQGDHSEANDPALLNLPPHKAKTVGEQIH